MISKMSTVVGLRKDPFAVCFLLPVLDRLVQTCLNLLCSVITGQQHQNFRFHTFKHGIWSDIYLLSLAVGVVWNKIHRKTSANDAFDWKAVTVFVLTDLFLRKLVLSQRNKILSLLRLIPFYLFLNNCSCVLFLKRVRQYVLTIQ